VIQAGGIPGNNSNINSSMSSFKTKLNTEFSNQVYTSTSGKMARDAAYYDTSVSTNLAAMGLSDAVYSTTDERTDNIDSLAANIDTASSMKDAMDLNNRLLVQMLHQQNQMIQIMAMQTEAASTQNYGVANSQAANADFNTFSPGL
jgi:conjugal transfer/entry exclusion protein